MEELLIELENRKNHLVETLDNCVTDEEYYRKEGAISELEDVISMVKNKL